MSLPTPPIFAETAPAYFAAGLPVIPLFAREKRPAVMDWSRFADTKPDERTQAEWLAQHGHGNIGLALGQAAGIIMIDIDTDEALVMKAITDVLPPSPWVRRGKKGVMLAYRWAPIKTFRVKNVSGQSIVECLSSRTQCVLPPSIHPDTGQPYEANCELLSVLGQLCPLPANIEELMRAAVAAVGVQLSHSGWSRVTDYVSAGSRDTTLTEMAGLFAFAVCRGERTLKEAVGMLAAYHSEYVEAVAGDQVGLDKHVSNLIRFLHRDVFDRGKILPKGWDEGYEKVDLEALGVTIGLEETQWDSTRMIEHLGREFEARPDGVQSEEVVQKMLQRIARSVHIDHLSEGRVLKYIVQNSGLGIGMTDLRKRLNELRRGEVAGNNQTEVADATVHDLEQYNVVRFHGGRFMKWAGSHWTDLSEQVIQAHISSRYGHLPACKKAGDIRGVMKIMTFVVPQGIQRKPVTGINFANGFLTEELKLLPHEPDFGMSYTLPYRFVPEDAGKFPLFAEFLHRSWGKDPDYQQKVDSLQEALAATLFGLGPKFQRVILLQGAPKSGKTQLLRIVESMVPREGKCSVPPNDWDDKFLPAMMNGKVLNICGELSERKNIDGQLFKDMVDGSERQAQHKNQPIFTMRPTVTHWFASNHIPRTTDTSLGFIRRWLFLTFNHPVSEAEKKLDIGDVIAAEEREAIVAWAIQSLPRLLQRKDYTLAPSHHNMVAEFAVHNSSVRYFMIESRKVKLNVPGAVVEETKLYDHYQLFCMAPGSPRAVSQMKFRAVMRELASELRFELGVSEVPGGGSCGIFKGFALVR